MVTQTERELLEKYAKAYNQKILDSQVDLDMKDRPMQEMLAWCRRQNNIIVLGSGTVLTSDPSARTVQNCKIVMQNQGLTPGRVLAATPELIHVLLANAEEEKVDQGDDSDDVQSAQQQRLRILVKEAVAIGASDIHIEVRPDVSRIRFRKHGELYLHAKWRPKLGREIASVAFNKETDHSITHFNPLVPQNASMPLEIGDQLVRLRLASLPAHGGFDVVMRILTVGEDKTQTLEDLGYPPEQLALIKKAIDMPHGAVIISGPTGSGKTTTLASAMRMINTDRKIYTIEDPVEKVIKNTTQIPVNTEHDDRGFANMGRSALRMDPDVIVLGEMRDEDTARVMVRAAITGHLIFSTLHTNSAPAIITRLVDMGISSSLLSDPNLLVCLICQRLVPKLCKHCAIPITEASDYEEHLARWEKVFGAGVKSFRVRGRHCDKCQSSGISGRTVIAEIIWVDEQGRHFIQKCDILGWEKYLKQHGWKSYSDHAASLVLNGICDPLDAEKCVGPFDLHGGASSFDYREVG